MIIVIKYGAIIIRLIYFYLSLQRKKNVYLALLCTGNFRIEGV